MQTRHTSENQLRAKQWLCFKYAGTAPEHRHWSRPQDTRPPGARTTRHLPERLGEGEPHVHASRVPRCLLQARLLYG